MIAATEVKEVEEEEEERTRQVKVRLRLRGVAVETEEPLMIKLPASKPKKIARAVRGAASALPLKEVYLLDYCTLWDKRWGSWMMMMMMRRSRPLAPRCYKSVSSTTGLTRTSRVGSRSVVFVGSPRERQQRYAIFLAVGSGSQVGPACVSPTPSRAKTEESEALCV